MTNHADTLRRDPAERLDSRQHSLSADPIAADVMAIAEDVAKRVFNAMHDDDGRLTDSDPAEIVARAIMAERERCAKIAPTLARVGFALNASEHGFADLVAKVTRSGEAV